MSVFVDILLLGLLVFMALRGYIRGFLKSVLSVGRLILAGAITVTFGSAFSEWINKAFVSSPVYDAVHGKIMAMAEVAGNNTDALLSDVSNTFGGLVDLSSLHAGEGINDMADKLSLKISGGISGAVSTVIGYVLLFALAFGVLTLVMLVVDKLTKLPLIHGCDKLLGLGLGLVGGVLVVSLVSTVLYAALYAAGQGEVMDHSVFFGICRALDFFKFDA